ncbi:RTA1 like protein [Sporothrix brasiliensis 5110]|uniref:RTA1 like protein n=1 Tax=Sporothrix brasiliensis 5110 TaxID=1398154 RepID=A0A0C2J1V7_9PEZI|nr:RTA1 like protein [Sporothrix brasiliensis 5110]KIH95296.1 RTA1 like protein [Sporothrix brasiliensis 5110]
MSSNDHPSTDDPNAWVPYRYDPSIAAAGVAVGLFGVLTVLHAAIAMRRRTWYFIPFCLGGICTSNPLASSLSAASTSAYVVANMAVEIAGYIGRILSSRDLWALGPYILQSVLLLVAPALFAASIYIVLGRIVVHVHGESCALVSPRWLTKVFVCGDVLSFLLQAGGGGYQAAGTLAALRTGERIILAGLFVQLVFFGVFVAVAAVFHVRFLRRSRSSSSPSTSMADTIPGGPTVWQRQITALYVASALIFVRSVFRVIEYLMGNDGYILRHEVFLYVFDGLLMLAVMIVFLLAHPSYMTRQTGTGSRTRIASNGSGSDALVLADMRKAARGGGHGPSSGESSERV